MVRREGGLERGPGVRREDQAAGSAGVTSRSIDRPSN